LLRASVKKKIKCAGELFPTFGKEGGSKGFPHASTFEFDEEESARKKAESVTGERETAFRSR